MTYTEQLVNGIIEASKVKGGYTLVCSFMRELSDALTSTDNPDDGVKKVEALMARWSSNIKP